MKLPHRLAALRRCATLGFLIVLAAGGAACETLISDSATRVAYAVRDGAARLTRSPSSGIAKPLLELTDGEDR